MQPGPMRNLTPIALLLMLGLAGCAMQMPDFVGRGGGQSSGVFTLREEPLPDPVPVPMRSARAERGLRGHIVRVEAVAPTQGFHSAELVPLNGGVPDQNGVMAYALVATPPATPQAIGPEQTRELRAAVFVPVRAMRNMNAVRISDANTAQTLSLR